MTDKFPDSLLPKRVYLMDQVQDVLRDFIKSGVWGEFMPGERALAERLSIGRMTLRQALASLEEEGLVEPGRQGSRRRIISPDFAGPPHRVNRVILLTPCDPHRLSGFLLFEIDILRRKFNEAQIRLDVLGSKAYNVKECSQTLERLTTLEQADLWILQMAPYHIQKWFDDQSEHSAMVIGYTYDNISLPYITFDLCAAAHHVVGLLASHGHRSIALLSPKYPLAGDVRVGEAIKPTCSRKNIHLQAIVYRDIPDDLCRSIDHALSKSNPPSAILSTMTVNIATCMTHLARRGLRVPEDLSVISLLDDSSLDYLVPKVTRYTVNDESFMRQVFVMAEKIITGRKDSYKHEKLIPELMKGKTLARRHQP